jgi:hypothetical protein
VRVPTCGRRDGAAAATRPGFRTGLGEVAGAAHQCRAGPHHRADEHRLALDLGVEREQRSMPGHLRQSEVDQITEIV